MPRRCDTADARADFPAVIVCDTATNRVENPCQRTDRRTTRTPDGQVGHPSDILDDFLQPLRLLYHRRENGFGHEKQARKPDFLDVSGFVRQAGPEPSFRAVCPQGERGTLFAPDLVGRSEQILVTGP